MKISSKDKLFIIFADIVVSKLCLVLPVSLVAVACFSLNKIRRFNGHFYNRVDKRSPKSN